MHTLDLKGKLINKNFNEIIEEIEQLLFDYDLNDTCDVIDLSNNNLWDRADLSDDELISILKTIPQNVTEVNLSNNGPLFCARQERAEILSGLHSKVRSLKLCDTNLALWSHLSEFTKFSQALPLLEKLDLKHCNLGELFSEERTVTDINPFQFKTNDGIHVYRVGIPMVNLQGNDFDKWEGVAILQRLKILSTMPNSLFNFMSYELIKIYTNKEEILQDIKELNRAYIHINILGLIYKETKAGSDMRDCLKWLRSFEEDHGRIMGNIRNISLPNPSVANTSAPRREPILAIRWGGATAFLSTS